MFTKTLLLVVSVNFLVSGEELPKGLEICRRSDPNFNACLAKAIEASIRFFRNGNAALDIPATDPYLIDQIEVLHSGGTSNFNLKSSLKNTLIKGLADANITRVKTKFDKTFGLKVESMAKSIEIIGDYTMNGQILVLPIKGYGKARNSMTDVKSLIDLRGEFFDRDNQTYINITSFKMKLTPQGASFSFENIFKGDPQLTETINLFMNDNWEVVEQTLLPGYEAQLGDRFRDIANKIFNVVPLKMIFPE